VLALLLLPSCATAAPRAAARLQVVAAEDVWGSITTQLAGPDADVHSLVANPAADPHDYEPTPADARAVADARLVIVNGVGYDPWARRLVAADHKPAATVLDVGDVFGRKEGDNPHQWYSPPLVDRFAQAVADRLKRLDPAHAAAYDRRLADFSIVALAPYHAAVAAIRGRFTGAPVAASENIFTPLADALGLRLVTPDSFLNAVSEGNEPGAADKAEVDRQLKTGAVKAFVYNSQNATPDVRRLIDEARNAHIPVVTVTETLTPRGATFQDWQTRQLHALQAALEAAA